MRKVDTVQSSLHALCAWILEYVDSALNCAEGFALLAIVLQNVYNMDYLMYTFSMTGPGSKEQYTLSTHFCLIVECDSVVRPCRPI